MDDKFMNHVGGQNSRLWLKLMKVYLLLTLAAPWSIAARSKSPLRLVGPDILRLVESFLG